MKIEQQIDRLNLVFSFAIILVLVVDLYFVNFLFVPITSVFFFLALIKINFSEIKKLKPLGGYANWVTGFRLINVFVIIGMIDSLSELQIGSWSLMIISLDGVDGYLARKFNLESKFGAQFDMESDSFFVASISFLLYKLGLADWWIIIPGFMRYFYLVLVFLLGLSKREERLSKWSKHIAVLFFISLITPFFLSDFAGNIFLIIASVSIVYSFGFAFVNRLNSVGVSNN